MQSERSIGVLGTSRQRLAEAPSRDVPSDASSGPEAGEIANAGELRFAIFSDVHGNLAGLREVAAAIEREPPLDRVVVAGDHLQGGPRPTEVWEMLNSKGWVLVRGNEDEALCAEDPLGDHWTSPFRGAFFAGVMWTRARVGAEALKALASLPDQWRVTTPAGDLLVVHASPRSIHDRAGGAHNTLAEILPAYGGTGASAIAFGHYHHSFVRPTPVGLLINVASVGLPRDRRPVACYTIVTANPGGWIVEQRQVPYNPAEETQAAAERGMPLWIPDPDC